MSGLRPDQLPLDPATLEVVNDLLSVVGGPGGGGGSIPKVEYFVTDGVGTVNTQKYLDLASTPSDPSAVKVIVVGGSYQLNAELNTPGSYEVIQDDFLNIRRINWDGFSMEAALTGPGIYIAVEYYINQATTTQASDITTAPFTGFLSGSTDVQEALNKVDSDVVLSGAFIGGSRLTVDPAHPLAADDANKATPFLTIQAAINVSSSSDEIFIASNGNTVYTEDLTIVNKSLHLVGSGNAITGLGTYIEGTMTVTGSGSLSLSHLYLSNYNTPATSVLDYQATQFLAIDGCYIDYTGTDYCLRFAGAEMYVYDSWVTSVGGDLLLFNPATSSASHVKNTELSGRVELQRGTLNLMNCRMVGDSYFQANHASNVIGLNLNSLSLTSETSQSPIENIGASTANINLRDVRLLGTGAPWASNTGGGTLNIYHQSLHVASTLSDPTDPNINLSSDRMAGFLTLDQDPTSAFHAATKQYADNKVRDQIQNGVTTSAPSENAVSDALALKQDAPSAGFKIQSGSFSISASTTGSFNFPTAFTNPPTVILTRQADAGSYTAAVHGVADTTAVSNTGFSWRAGRFEALSGTGGGTLSPESGSILHWVAMGV